MSKIVYLDAGHGAGDPGAVGYGFTEEKLAIKVVDRLAYWYKKYGVIVKVHPQNKNSYTDRFYDTFADDNTEVLEVHFNGSDNKNATGTEVLIHPNLNPDEYDLAILDASDDFTLSRGVKKEVKFYNMDSCLKNGVPYRLLECAFITNPNDIKKFDSDAEIDQYAKRIVEKTYSALGGKKYEGAEDKKVYSYIVNDTPNDFMRYNMRINTNRKGARFDSIKCDKAIGFMRDLKKSNDGNIYVNSRYETKLEKDGYIWNVHSFLNNKNVKEYFVFESYRK